MMHFKLGKKRPRRAPNVAAAFADADDDDGTDHELGTLPPQERTELKVSRLRDEGSLLAESGRFREAMGQWSEALQCDPPTKVTAVLYELLAQAYLGVDEDLAAVKVAHRAVELAPEWAEARVTLGNAQRNFGELALAVGSYREALRLSPSLPEAHEGLEDAEELMRRQRAAAAAAATVFVGDWGAGSSPPAGSAPAGGRGDAAASPSSSGASQGGVGGGAAWEFSAAEEEEVDRCFRNLSSRGRAVQAAAAASVGGGEVRPVS